MAEGPCIEGTGGLCEYNGPPIVVEAPRPDPNPPADPALVPFIPVAPNPIAPINPPTSSPTGPYYQSPFNTPKPPGFSRPPPRPPPEAPPRTPIPEIPELLSTAAAPVLLSAAVISALIGEGLNAIFNFEALPRRGDRIPIRYTGGVALLPIDPITLQPIPDISYEPIPELETVTVTAPREDPHVYPPMPEVIAEPPRVFPSTPREQEQLTPLVPLVSRPAAPPRVQSPPRTIINPWEITNPGTMPKAQPITVPRRAPVPAPRPKPIPGIVPTPRPGSIPSPPVYNPYPGAYGAPLTGAQPGVAPLPQPKAQPQPKAPAEAQAGSCVCPGKKNAKEQKDYGCEQGYYRETKEGISYKRWSTRKCQSSKGNSRSQQQARPITS